MSTKPNREVFGVVLKVTRAIGLILIVLAILGLPQNAISDGTSGGSFEVTMS